MASLLVYLNYGATGTIDFTRTIFKLSTFAPFLSSLYLLINKYELQIHSVISITSTFFTLTQYLFGGRLPIPEVLSHTGEVISYILSQGVKLTKESIKVSSPVSVFNQQFSQSGSQTYFHQFVEKQNSVCLIESDIRRTFRARNDLEVPSPDAITDSLNINTFLRVYLPFDIQLQSGTLLLKLDKFANLILFKVPKAEKYIVYYPNLAQSFEKTHDEFVKEGSASTHQAVNSLPQEINSPPPTINSPHPAISSPHPAISSPPSDISSSPPDISSIPSAPSPSVAHSIPSIGSSISTSFQSSSARSSSSISPRPVPSTTNVAPVSNNQQASPDLVQQVTYVLCDIS